MRVAGFFWFETVEQFSGEYAIPIRELARYVKEVYGLPAEKLESDLQPEDEDKMPVIDGRAIGEDESSGTQPLPLACIKQWSAKFFDSLLIILYLP